MSKGNGRSPGALDVWCWLLGLVLLLTGLFFAVGGAKLVSLGGSAYFLVAGIVTVLAAIQLFRRRAAAVPLYGLVLIGTLAWAWVDAAQTSAQTLPPSPRQSLRPVRKTHPQRALWTRACATQATWPAAAPSTRPAA